ncbi:hypothetical protein Desku_2848 [Desulfofundulus kuznetsovii DSM 6115]|uniref:Uncharacterized protein n=1 Tax=Desulfofundulus kuznetsovii (strain DSM 6115 / VKM B-1805 / 17) TaxID=760568 RepID=A0AAU8PYJ0_DESK7|nr:hypothetical protein Desku_2848 [Desulfofundulus kuznetsovii DSM 6115]
MKKNNQGKAVRHVITWGIITLAAYLLVFLNEHTVTGYFSRGGGLAAAGVIITAITFSIIHGSFANYLLEMFDIKPLKKGVH